MSLFGDSRTARDKNQSKHLYYLGSASEQQYILLSKVFFEVPSEEIDWPSSSEVGIWYWAATRPPPFVRDDAVK